MVSKYSREPRGRSTSRDQEDERSGQDNGRRGTPPTLEKGARILAALRRLSAQDRPRDTGRRCGSSPLGHVSAASFPASRQSLLDERQDLGPEFLHTREDFLGC